MIKFKKIFKNTQSKRKLPQSKLKLRSPRKKMRPKSFQINQFFYLKLKCCHSTKLPSQPIWYQPTSLNPLEWTIQSAPLAKCVLQDKLIPICTPTSTPGSTRNPISIRYLYFIDLWIPVNILKRVLSKRNLETEMIFDIL